MLYVMKYWTFPFTVFRPSVPTGLLGAALLGGAGISSFSFTGSIYKMLIYLFIYFYNVGQNK